MNAPTTADAIAPDTGSEAPLFRRPGVHRFLVTGGDDELLAFHAAVCWFANDLEERGQTIFYTVFDEDLEAFIYSARKTGVTVQQRQDNSPPFWLVVVRGLAAPWSPPKEK